MHDLDPSIDTAAHAPLEPLRSLHRPYERLRALIRTERENVWIVLVYALGAGLFSLAIPLAVQSLVNTIAFETLLQPVIVLSVLLLLALVFQGTMQALQTYTAELIQQRLFVRVVADLAYRLPLVKREAFDHQSGPELVNRFFSVVSIQKASGLLLMDGLAVMLQTAIGLVLLAFYHPILLAFDVMLVLGLAFVLFVLGRGATSSSVEESKNKYAMAAWLEEIARHPGAFKSTDAAVYAIERTDKLALKYLASRRKHFRVIFRQLVGLLTLGAVSSALLLGLGGWLVVQRQLTLGQLVASEFIVAAVVAGFVKLAKHLETYFDLLADVDKLGHLIELPLEREDGIDLPRPIGPASVALRELSCSIGDHPVLRTSTWDVSAGSRIGIVGSDGSGKSSLLDLIAGLREPTAGSIEIDGYDLRDLSLRDLRRQVMVVRQTDIVAATILDNLRMGREEFDHLEARQALETLLLWEDVRVLPEGLSTVLSPEGYPLSPREAKRLTLARALAAKPRLMMLDEGLDGLNSLVRERAFDAFFSPSAPWTLIVVSRDPEVLERCDVVYVLEDGSLQQVPHPVGSASQAWSSGKEGEPR